jgi:hypothetical protein
MANDNETFPTILKQPDTTTTLAIVCKKLLSNHHAHYKQGGTSRSITEEFSSHARKHLAIVVVVNHKLPFGMTIIKGTRAQ